MVETYATLTGPNSIARICRLLLLCLPLAFCGSFLTCLPHALGLLPVPRLTRLFSPKQALKNSILGKILLNLAILLVRDLGISIEGRQSLDGFDNEEVLASIQQLPASRQLLDSDRGIAHLRRNLLTQRENSQCHVKSASEREDLHCEFQVRLAESGESHNGLVILILVGVDECYQDSNRHIGRVAVHKANLLRQMVIEYRLARVCGHVALRQLRPSVADEALESTDVEIAYDYTAIWRVDVDVQDNLLWLLRRRGRLSALSYLDDLDGGFCCGSLFATEVGFAHLDRV
ncbi:hypothetical protein EJ03DRAFT_115311 [Teratosphaeria nubilosa]|uniref:Uncharacterized protein n=1 Tax=Teratosphaeria nubilosa TaxID=161662 RepID=A0A6G1L6V8_9PEZI|nr:hypothetical protein EJ03DRAFT_115311 [Teratosphaeria nubilosa]